MRADIAEQEIVSLNLTSEVWTHLSRSFPSQSLLRDRNCVQIQVDAKPGLTQHNLARRHWFERVKGYVAQYFDQSITFLCFSISGIGTSCSIAYITRILNNTSIDSGSSHIPLYFQIAHESNPSPPASLRSRHQKPHKIFRG
jgi:hypothetical protein